MRISHNGIFSGTLLSIALSMGAASAYAEEISLKAGESVDLGAVYWIQNCQSILKGFGSVDLLEGPPGIDLTIREENVTARRQNCPNKVPGGTVVLTAKEVQSKFSGVLKYRVRYKTEDGDRQSSHSKNIALYPK